MSRFTLSLIGALSLSALIACDKDEPVVDDTTTEADADTDADADSDSDSDSDADSDADADADADSDADADTDPETELYKVRTGVYAAGDGVTDSGNVGDTVTITGALTSDQNRYGFFLSDGQAAEYHAIQIYTPDDEAVTSEFKAGDVVQVTGEYVEYSSGSPADSQAEIVVLTDADLVASTEPHLQQPATVASMADLITASEGWESGLVTLENLTISNNDLGYGEWEITDGTDTYRVDDLIYDFTDDGNVLSDGDTFGSITGVVYWSFGAFKLEPRSSADFVDYVAYEAPCFADKCAKDLVAGDVIVTEIMYNPADYSDSYGEYIEIYNASGGTISLEGLVIEDDGGNTGSVAQVDATATFADGDYIVIAVGDGSSWEYTTFTADGYYGKSIAFGNSGDQAILKNAGGTLFTSPTYSTSGGKGYAYNVDGSGMMNQLTAEDSSNWCPATSNIEGNEYGTPGAANDACVAK